MVAISKSGRLSTELQVLKDLGDQVEVQYPNGTKLILEKRRIETLPDGQRLLAILWNGGWDDYLVSSEDMIQDHSSRTNYEPVFTVAGVQYVRTYFSARWRKEFPDKAFRIVRHLDGGD